MTRSVKWSAATAGLVVVLFVGAWFLLIAPQRAAAADLREQTVARESANVVLKQKIAVLKTQAQDLPKQRARLAAIAEHLPPTPALPTLVRNLDKQAKASGVVLKKLNPVVPMSAEPTTTTAVPVTPGPRAAASGPYLQSIALEMEVTGDFAQLEDFLYKTEDLRRSFLNTRVLVVNEKPGDPKIVDGKIVSTDELLMTINSTVFIATPNAPRPPAGTPGG